MGGGCWGFDGRVVKMEAEYRCAFSLLHNGRRGRENNR